MSETGTGFPPPHGANSRRHPSTALTAGRVLSARKSPHLGDPATSLALTLTKPGSPVTFSDGCGSSEVSWLRCEDLAVLVFRVVDAFVLAAEVEAPVSVEVADGNERAELQDGLGAFEAPSCARSVHSVLD